MRFFYNISIFFYYLAIRIASLFNPKALLWLKGRKNVFDRIESAIRTSESKQLIWFHCASLGEFEQGRPLMEKFKKQNPSVKIILTFISLGLRDSKKLFRSISHFLFTDAYSIQCKKIY